MKSFVYGLFGIIVFWVGIDVFAISDSNLQNEATVRWSNFKLEVETKLKISRNIPIYERHQIRDTSKNEILRRASLYLEKIVIDRDYTLGDLLDESGEFAERYAIFLEKLDIHSLYFRKHQIETKLNIPLRGKNGLISILPYPWGEETYAAGKKEFMGEAYLHNHAVDEYLPQLAKVQYSGLVINLTEFSVNKSLAPRVYNQYGKLIYGPEFLYADIGKERGILSYVTSMKEKELKARAGANPLITVALAIKGKNRTDAVISDEDSARLFAHTETVTNLRKARVVFLIQ